MPQENNLEFNLGGGLSTNDTIRDFIKVYQVHAEWLYPETRIVSVFDSFPGLIWNGGRTIPGPPMPFDDMVRKVNFFNEKNIGVFFTFSNGLLAEKHLEHELCNKVLKTFENPLNGVVVCSDLLEKYIRAVCPRYKITLSVQKLLYDRAELLKAYTGRDFVVVLPEFYSDLNFLKTLPADKTEIMANECCVPYCKFRKEHYAEASKISLEGLLKERMGCKHADKKDISQRLFFTRESILQIHNATNIYRIKITTRKQAQMSTINVLALYLINPIQREKFSDFMQTNSDRE